MFASDLKPKNCFISCSIDKIKAGLCSCRNSKYNEFYKNFTIDMRVLRLEEILKNLNKI